METREIRGKPAEITHNALQVLTQRYFLKDAVDHPIEDVDELELASVGGAFLRQRLRSQRLGDGRAREEVAPGRRPLEQ